MPKGPVKTLMKDYVGSKPGDSDHKGPKYAESDLNSPKLVIGMEIKDEPTDLFPISGNVR